MADLETEKRGKLLVLEGTDGSGKETQTNLVSQHLSERDIPHKTTSFPRYGTFWGKHINTLKSGGYGPLSTLEPQLVGPLYMLNRMEAKPEIEQWLQEGNLVIIDRYVPSNMAYMGALAGHTFEQATFDWIEEAEYEVNGMPREDLVCLLDVHPEYSAVLAIKRGKTDEFEKNFSLQQRVARNYHSLAATKEHWQVIHCMEGEGLKSQEEIAREIIDVFIRRNIIPA